GGITNAGTISAAAFGSFGGLGISVDNNFAGGITNQGRIIADKSGIGLRSAGTFTGGITNAGTISAGLHARITLSVVTTFSGKSYTGGIITAPTGIMLNIATVSGQIVVSGNVLASRAGLRINALSSVSSSLTTVKITASTFTGGMINAGTIS